jgi:glutathione peroxidase-family protein
MQHLREMHGNCKLQQATAVRVSLAVVAVVASCAVCCRLALQDKLEVNGPGAHPLYQFLRQQQPLSAPGQARPVPGGGGPGAIEW